MEDYNECCFCPDKTTNARRGPTDKQPDADPFQEKLRTTIESRVGKSTSETSGMSMSDKPFFPGKV